VRISDSVAPAISRLRKGSSRRRLAVAGCAIIALLVSVLLATGAGTPSAHGASGPHNTVAPTISGTPQAGQTLTATTGTWVGTGLILYAIQWQSCDATGASCLALAGATSASFTLGSTEVNHTLRVVVTAKDSTGSAAVTSSQTGIVASAPVGAPDVSTPPTIVGAPKVNAAVTSSTGTWTGIPPISYTYAWQRCDANGGSCVPIPNASAASYTVVDADAGGTLRVVVTASNVRGAASTTSVPSAVVPGTPSGITVLPGGGKSVEVAGIALPNQLVIGKVAFTPRQLSNRNPFTLQVTVRDSRGYAVQGALVYALGVPYSRIQSAPELPTAIDGTVTLTLHPLAGLSLGTGQYLVIFLRARQPGAPINGGVSVRQLVQLRTGPPA
jgi:hypothetical protein